MDKSTLYLAGGLALFASGVAAEILAIPEATGVVHFPLDQIFDHMPQPTEPPSAELVRRQTNSDISVLLAPDSICGYIDGRSGVAFSCLDADFSCLFITASATRTGNVACCNGETCGVRYTCLDYGQVSSQSLCDSGCMLDVYTLKCTNSAQPYCNTISFSSDIMDYWCNSFEDNSIQRAFTTYPGQSGREFRTVALSDLEASNTDIDNILPDQTTTSTTSTQTTATLRPPPSGDDDDETTSNGSSPTGGSDNSNGGDSDNSNDGGSSTPIGPIVGGVLGGVALLAAVGFGIWFIMRRRKREAAAAAGGIPPMQQTQQVPPQGPPPGPYGGVAPAGQGPVPVQYYDPSKNGYAQTDYQPSPPPGYPPQPHHQQQQQQHLVPGPYYAHTIPDRHDTTSPSAVSNASMHRLSTVTPGSPGSQAPGQFMQGGYAPQGGQQGYPQQPGQQTIHEAPGPHDGHHRGQMHEMA